MAGIDVDEAFVKALPKVELHAHLSGSISPTALHELWRLETASGRCLDLLDPLVIMRPGGDFVDIATFFPLFDEYIYELVDDLPSLKFATRRVLEAFERDGVRYLELRTTPREILPIGFTKPMYVAAVNQSIGEWNGAIPARTLEVRLILSVDRRMSAQQAEEVVDLAISHQYGKSKPATANGDNDNDATLTETLWVVGVDLCGNPTKGEIADFTPVFQRAKAHGLGITLHFA